MMTKEELQQLLITLESIEVHGRVNLDKLLGCIIFISNKLKGDQNGGLPTDADGK